VGEVGGCALCCAACRRSCWHEAGIHACWRLALPLHSNSGGSRELASHRLHACLPPSPPGPAPVQPAQLLCGIAERGAHVHLMSVYRDPFSDGGYDDNISLSLKLPEREDSLYGPE
jgi:hypothetical protein